jgi:hypothetical protein
MAELYTGVPILPGTSEEDMLYKLSNLIGHPPPSIQFSNRHRSSLSSTALKNPTQD